MAYQSVSRLLCACGKGFSSANTFNRGDGPWMSLMRIWNSYRRSLVTLDKFKSNIIKSALEAASVENLL